MIALTPLILTYNEQENIGRVLAALAWAQEVVVVDSFSTDGTLEIAARAHANIRIVQRRFDNFAAQWNFGLEQIRTPWVLSLDADYEVTEELAREIQTLTPASNVAGYDANFRYCIWGKALRGTVYPPRTILFRRELADYYNDGHTQRLRVREGNRLPLRGRVRHDDRKPLSRWLQSQDKYMLAEAPYLLAEAPAQLSVQDRLRRRGTWSAFVMFVYLLFAKGLIFDGWPGWYYVLQRTLAEAMLSLRLISVREKLEEPSAKHE